MLSIHFQCFYLIFFPPMCVCVTFCVCMTKKKNNFSDPFASPLNLHAIFSHLEWGGMHHPMLFLFSFLMSHAFFFFISSFPFIVWSSGAVYFWIFFGRLFLLKCDCSLFFFLDEDSLPVRSVEPPPCMFIFFFLI